jgi:hypothetical protein
MGNGAAFTEPEIGSRHLCRVKQLASGEFFERIEYF